MYEDHAPAVGLYEEIETFFHVTKRFSGTLHFCKLFVSNLKICSLKKNSRGEKAMYR